MRGRHSFYTLIEGSKPIITHIAILAEVRGECCERNFQEWISGRRSVIALMLYLQDHFIPWAIYWRRLGRILKIPLCLILQAKIVQSNLRHVGLKIENPGIIGGKESSPRTSDRRWSAVNVFMQKKSMFVGRTERGNCPMRISHIEVRLGTHDVTNCGRVLKTSSGLFTNWDRLQTSGRYHIRSSH